MSGSEQQRRVTRFGVFELEAASGELRRSGRLVALTGQPMRVLVRLVERAGEIVTREELQHEIWGGDTHVDFDAGLSTCINQIRTALGDRAASPRFVATVPRRGYRFIAPVEPVPIRLCADIHEHRVMSAFRWLDKRQLALAVLIISIVVPIWERRSASPIPIAVIAVDVDASTPHLEPVSRTLTEALTGTLVSAMGDRGRVASPMVAKKLGEMTNDQIMAGGTEYLVLVTLRSLGGPILVHVKLVHASGWVKWAADRSLPLDQLEREQLRLATELSKQVADAITRS
uniref:Lysine decarboxylase transcriptional regulator n=1 Tax=uncultured Acidobacteria bacterium A12 TaxID=1036855 RepID=F8TTL8_9BACT|nr:lysine decarboxylase transcriptional regulator [uncultured Acidobacteria bacterium A12]